MLLKHSGPFTLIKLISIQMNSLVHPCSSNVILSVSRASVQACNRSARCRGHGAALWRIKQK